MKQVRTWSNCLMQVKDVCLASVGRLFQTSKLLYENPFCSFDVFFIGIQRFVDVSLRIREVLWEFLTKRSEREPGARPLIDLHIIVCIDIDDLLHELKSKIKKKGFT